MTRGSKRQEAATQRLCRDWLDGHGGCGSRVVEDVRAGADQLSSHRLESWSLVPGRPQVSGVSAGGGGGGSFCKPAAPW